MSENLVVGNNAIHEQPLRSSNLLGGRAIAYPQGAAWIGLVRRPFESTGMRIETAETVAACRHALDRWPRSLLVVELAADEMQVRLRLVAEAQERWPDVRVVVVATSIGAESELLVRQMGVSDVIRNIADFGRLTALARSHLRQQPPHDLLCETLRAIGMNTEIFTSR